MLLININDLWQRGMNTMNYFKKQKEFFRYFSLLHYASRFRHTLSGRYRTAALTMSRSGKFAILSARISTGTQMPEL